jgi:hypothetical protein
VQLDSLKELYAAKTDEELIFLAQEKDSLVENAQLALLDELKRRSLPIPVIQPLVETAPTVAIPEFDRPTNSPAPSRIAWLGLFLLDTFLVYLCAIHLSPFLVGRWFAWIAPVLGIPITVTPANWYLRHLELATIIPAFIAGYVDMGRFLPATVGKQIATWRSGSAASLAWIVPTTLLLWSLLSFHSQSSVLFDSSTSALAYYFKIQNVMPTLSNFLDSDPVRVRSQMFVTAPFYASVAFSAGALAWKHRLLPRLVSHLS